MADVKFKVGRVALSTAVAGSTQDFEIPGFGATPKAAIFILSGATVDDTITADARIAVGWCNATNEEVISCGEVDGVTTTDNGVMHSNAACITLVDGASSNELAFSFNSFGVDKVTLDIDIAATGAYLCTYILIGGNDVTNTHVGYYDDFNNTTTDITSIGFEPDMAFFTIANIGNAVPATTSNSRLTFGAWLNDGLDTQKCIALDDQTGVTTTNVNSYISDGAALTGSFNGSLRHEAVVGSADASGFTFTLDSTNGAGLIPFYLCLKFANTPNLALFDMAWPTSGNYAETGPGFEPSFGMLFSLDGPAARNTDSLGVGFSVAAFDSSNIYTTNYTSVDNVGLSDTQSHSDDRLKLIESDGATVGAVASSYAFDTSGWDFTLSTNPASPILGFGLAIEGPPSIDYEETIDGSSIASATLTDTFYSPVDTLLINSIAAVSAEDVYFKPEADIKFKVGRVALGSGTSQDFEIPGFGGVPKAAIFILSGARTPEVAESDAVFSIGWCDGTTQGTVGIVARDNQTDTTTLTGRQPFKTYTDEACIAVTHHPSYLTAKLSFASFSEDKVTLFKEDYNLTAKDYLCTFILIGGNDVTDTHIGFHDDIGNGPFPTGPINVDTVGFEPSLIFVASPNDYGPLTTIPAESFGTNLSIGAWINDGLDTQKAVGISIPRPYNGSGTIGDTYVHTYQSDIAAVLGVNTIPTDFPKLAIGGANANGFVLDTPVGADPVPVQNQIPFYFCLKLANNPNLALFDVVVPEKDVQSFEGTISYSNVDYIETGPGFYPDFGMLFTTATNSYNYNSNSGLVKSNDGGVFTATAFDDKVLSSTTYTGESYVTTTTHKSFVSDIFTSIDIDGANDSLLYERKLTADGWVFKQATSPDVNSLGFGLAIGRDILPAYVETANISATCTVDVDSILPGIGAVITPAPVVEAIGQPEIIIVGNLTNPIATVVGELVNPGYIAGAVSAPATVVSGILFNSPIITGSVQNPLATVQGNTGIGGALVPKIAVVNGSGFTGSVSVGVIKSPSPVVASVVESTALIIGQVSGPRPIVIGSTKSGTIIYGDVIARVGSVAAEGLVGSVSIGDIVAVSPQSIGSLLSEIIIYGDIIASTPIVYGISTRDYLSYVTWVMNTENGLVSNYTDFPFIALGQLGENNLGVAADGIYLLEGDDDAGVDIDTSMQFGMADFRAELLDTTDLYVGGLVDADMVVGILEDQQVTEYTYPLLKRDQHVRGHHAKLGKGFRGRYRRLSINNVGGEDFTLDSLALSSNDIRGKE